MNNISNETFLKFKNNSNVKKDELNVETLKSTISDINLINNKIRSCRLKIMKCNDLEEFNKIDISSISNDLGLIVQNSILIADSATKMNIEELNQSYRSLEILYFNKKINLLTETINKTVNDSEQNIKDITGGTLFSIASVFLGISLTSSLVAGVLKIDDHFVILYFMTCLLLAVITIGIAAIFMRKIDKKSIIITIIVILVSLLWGIIAYFTYTDYNIDNQRMITDAAQKTSQNNQINKE